jgi:L-iditol 2-dehydrogenase
MEASGSEDPTVSHTIPSEAIALGKLASGVGNIGLRQQTVLEPGPDQVILEVLATGICGTDLHIVDDEFPYEAPVTMGHEVTGEVVALGSEVDETWIGKRVACETYFFYCERCQHCRAGHPNLCDRRRSIGSKVDGGFTRWMTIPVRNLHVLPDTVGSAAGALTEPLACVTNCLFDPPVINAGDRVLVIGPGTMGILTAQAARAAGGEVIVVGLETDRHRLYVADALDLETLVLGTGRDDLDPKPDVVCECSGSEGGAAYGLAQVRKGGRFVQVGIFGRPIDVPLDQVLYKELVFTSGNASTPTSWHRAIALLEQGSVVLDPLVSEIVPLAEWERAFASTREGRGMKVVIDPRDRGGELGVQQ